MIDFFVGTAQMTLESGTRIRIRRAGFGRLFCLAWMLMDIREKSTAASKAASKGIQELEMYQLENDEHERMIREETGHFLIEPSALVLSEKDLHETVRKIIAFNMGMTPDADPQKTTGGLSTKEALEDEFIQTLSKLVSCTGWSVEYTTEEIDYVQATALIRQFNSLRAERVIDYAAVVSGQVMEHIANLRGKTVKSIGSIIREKAAEKKRAEAGGD